MFDCGNVIAEYDHDNFLLRKYIYGPGADEPVCMIDVVDSNSVYYYHYDGLGSVVALSDSAGDTVQTYEYSIYGQVAASEPEFLTNPYMFTGRRFDIETGLYYYRARYYNPYIGRFLQTDPVGYGAGINWYLYCGNNPLAFVDPSGYKEISISIPLHTVWYHPSSDRYLLANPEHSHKIDVNAYLKDASFYDLYPDATLESVNYSDGYYECVFDVPDESDIEMDIISINGVQVFYVTSESTITPIIDARLATMINAVTGASMSVTVDSSAASSAEENSILNAAKALAMSLTTADEAMSEYRRYEEGVTTGTKIPGSEVTHYNHIDGGMQPHKHWLEIHVNPNEPTKWSIERGTGPV